MLTTEITETSHPFRIQNHNGNWFTVCVACETIVKHHGGDRPEPESLVLIASRYAHKKWCDHLLAEIITPETAAARAAHQERDAAAKSAGHDGANSYDGSCSRCKTPVAALAGAFLRGRPIQVFHLDPEFCRAETVRRARLRSGAMAPPLPPSTAPDAAPAPPVDDRSPFEVRASLLEIE